MLGDTNIKLLKARINHLLLPKYPKYAGIYIYLVQQFLMSTLTNVFSYKQTYCFFPGCPLVMMAIWVLLRLVKGEVRLETKKCSPIQKI